MDNNIAYSYSTILPPQYNVEWDEEYWRRCIRGVAAQWNFNVVKNNPMAIDTSEIGIPLGFAQRAFFWKDYYLGHQYNIDYNHYLLKPDGTRNLLKMFRGKDITKFVNYMMEQVIDTVSNIPKTIVVKGVSDDIVSARLAQLNFEKFIAANSNFMKMMQQNYNVAFETLGGQRFMNEYQSRMQGDSFIDTMESGALNVAKDQYFRNQLDEKYVEVGFDIMLTGVGAMFHSIVNGYNMIERVPVYELIFPPSVFGDQHRYDSYAGRVRFMTIPELFATYPEIPDQDKDEIQDMAKTFSGQTSYFNQFNSIGAPSFYWWNQMDGVLRVAVVHAQWASYRTDENKKQHQCLREGILIGNKYLLNNKISTNQTEDWRNPSQTQLDYQIVQPMNVFGQNMGVPEILYTYQNQIDAWQTKIDEFISRAKGKVFIINSSKLAVAGIDAISIVSDFADMGLTVLPDVDIDAGQMAENKIVEPVDMTLSADVIQLWSSIKEYRYMMSDILNIPDAARGQMKGYNSQDMISTTIGQSNKGTAYFYNPINKFFRRILEKGVDKFKTSTLSNPDFEYNLIVSETEMALFKSTKNFGLSKFALNIEYEDMVDKNFKASIDQMVFAYAQNSTETGYTWSDLFQVQSMSTKSEIRDYLEMREKQIEAKRQQQQALAAQQQMAMQAQQVQGQKEMAAMKEDNENARTAAKIESDHVMQDKQVMHEVGQQPRQEG